MNNLLKKTILLAIFFVSIFIFWFSNWDSISKDKEFIDSLNYMYNNGLTKYSEIEKFMPTNNLTREQASKFLSEFFINNNFEKKSTNFTCEFKDINESDSTLKDFIIKSCELWIFKWSNWYFYPKQNITKAQLLTAIVRIIDWVKDETSNPWFLNYFITAQKLNLTKETDYKNLEKNVTRYESALIIFRSLKKWATEQNNKFSIEYKTWVQYSQISYPKTQWKINLLFNQDMDRMSVEKNIKTYPELKLEYNWKDDKSLEIDYETQVWDEDIEYILNVWENALSISWENLWKPIIKTFKTSWISKIDFVSPDWEISDLNQSITVRFSKPIIWLTTLDTQPNCPIKVEPNLDWKCIWITTSTFQFRPTNWFPIWWIYKFLIPEWIQTLNWDKTQNSSTFYIKTPLFENLNSNWEIEKDKPLLIIFNSDLDLNKFISNFEIQWISKDELDIKYFKNNWKINENIISIYPKNWDFWYWNSYFITLKNWLTSKRWNIWIQEKKLEFTTNNFVRQVNPFILIDEKADELYHINNFKFSSTSSIITKENPKILLELSQDADLDKNLFKIDNTNYEIFYAKETNCESWQCKTIENKKKIIISIISNIENWINLTTNSPDKFQKQIQQFTFNTKQENQIINFKFIDYKKSCIEFKNKASYYNYYNKKNNSWDNITLDWFWNIISIYEVYDSQYYDDIWCGFEQWKNKYLINSFLNPDQQYNLTFKKWFLDEDNYWLDKEYNYNFKTNIADNEDKNVSLIDYRWFIQVPTDLNPINIWIQSQNINKILVKICEWDLNIAESNFISNKVCSTKEVEINNLWFSTNFSVINLNQIFGKNFSKNILSFSIEKIDQDKTQYQKSDSYNSQEIIIQRSDISIVKKLGEKSKLVWISNTKNWVNIDNLKSLKSYIINKDYSSNKFSISSQTDINFQNQKNWIYKLNDYDIQNNYNTIYQLYEFEDWQKFLYSDYEYITSPKQYYSYIYTDTPIYKAWDIVKIKWVIQKRNFDWFNTNMNIDNTFNLTINDPNYNEVYTTKLSLSKNNSFEAEFETNKDFKLWTYTINIEWDSQQFMIEEFEKSDFKIDLNSDKQNYLFWDSANIWVSANYFIWKWVSNWQWNYSINTKNYKFDWWKTLWYIWWENNDWYYYNDEYFYNWNDYWESIISNQKFNLNNEWKTNLNIELKNYSNWQINDKIYEFISTVQDPQTKKSISKSINFKVLNSDIFVWMKLDKFYYDLWDNMKIDFATVDNEWNKKSNIPLNLKISKLSYNQNKTTYIYEEIEENIVDKEINTDNNWIANHEFQISKPWKYKIEISIDWKNYKTTKMIYVSWQDLYLPKDNQNILNIIQEKNEYKIGETATFIFQSPYTWVNALITQEKENWILDYKIVQIDSNSFNHKIKIEKQHAPNFYLNVFLIKNSQNSEEKMNKLIEIRTKMQQLEQQLFSWNNWNIFCPIVYDLSYNIVWCYKKYNFDENDSNLLELSNLRKLESELLQELIPQYMIWKQNIKISLDDFKLKTNINIEKTTYLPWDKVEFDLDIKDNNWNPVNWEATLSIVDEWLLQLKNLDKNILDFFYENAQNYILTTYSISNFIKRIEFLKQEEIQTSSDESWKSLDKWLDYDTMEEESLLWNIAPQSTFNENAKMKKDDWELSDSDLWWSIWELAWIWNDEKIRTDFKDIAYYNWTIKVENWKAKIIVDKLPDNLTNWIIKWFVFNNEMFVWNFTWEFSTNKKILLIPSIPRFFVAWDKTTIWATIINNTDKQQNAQVRLTISNTKIWWEQTKDISISPNWQEYISFDIEFDWMNFEKNYANLFSTISLWVSNEDFSDQMISTKKIFPYSTPEYTFTNWLTNDLSYEEKLIIPENINKNDISFDVKMFPTLISELNNNFDFIADDINYDFSFYYVINNLYKYSLIKWFYESIWEKDKLNEILTKKWVWKIDDIINDLVWKIKSFQQIDWWFSYTKDCVPYVYLWYQYKCSEEWLTSNYLVVANKISQYWINIDSNITNNALNFYKTSIKSIIDDYKRINYEFKEIYPFYVLSFYKENKFIEENMSKNIDINSNIDLVYLIKIKQNLWQKNDEYTKLINQLQNNLIIEARWTLLPMYNNQVSSNNILSTALWVDIYINQWTNEKLIVENMVRWLVAQKDYEWNYWSVENNSSIIEILIEYVKFTKELENLNYKWVAFFNWNEILSYEFNEKNKFDISQKTFSSKELPWISQSNSFWFEKNWTWLLYYDVWFKYFLPIEQIDARDEWVIINRKYFNYDEYLNYSNNKCDNIIFDYWNYWYLSNIVSYNCYSNVELNEVNWWNQWDLLVWEIEIIVPHERNNLIVENFIPAWAEILNSSFDNVSSEVKNIEWTSTNSNYWDYDYKSSVYEWLDYNYYPNDYIYYWNRYNHKEIKDEKLVLYANKLYKWSYKFTYVIKLNHKWEYNQKSAIVYDMKKPEIFWRTKSSKFEIK